MHGGHIEREESPISFVKPKITKHVHLALGLSVIDWIYRLKVIVPFSTPFPETKRWQAANISHTVVLV